MRKWAQISSHIHGVVTEAGRADLGKKKTIALACLESMKLVLTQAVGGLDKQASDLTHIGRQNKWITPHQESWTAEIAKSMTNSKMLVMSTNIGSLVVRDPSMSQIPFSSVKTSPCISTIIPWTL